MKRCDSILILLSGVAPPRLDLGVIVAPPAELRFQLRCQLGADHQGLHVYTGRGWDTKERPGGPPADAIYGITWRAFQ